MTFTQIREVAFHPRDRDGRLVARGEAAVADPLADTRARLRRLNVTDPAAVERFHRTGRLD